MSAILTTVFSLLSSIPGQLGAYFAKKQELEAIKLETQKQVALAQQQMASDMAKAESQTAITRLNMTGSTFKYFTFVMWFGPFIVGVFMPSWSTAIFTNLKIMPDWYVQSCMMIMFAVWGISVSGPVVANIFSGLNSYLADKRDYKLQAKQIDRDILFKSLRKIKGPLSQEDVQTFDTAINDAEKTQ